MYTFWEWQSECEVSFFLSSGTRNFKGNQIHGVGLGKACLCHFNYPPSCYCEHLSLWHCGSTRSSSDGLFPCSDSWDLHSQSSFMQILSLVRFMVFHLGTSPFISNSIFFVVPSRHSAKPGEDRSSFIRNETQSCRLSNNYLDIVNFDL